MEHSYVNLGYLAPKTIVTVTLSSIANVYLMDSQNYYRYSHDNSFNALGGRVTISPISFTVPTRKNWFLTIDLGGYDGNIRFSYKIVEPVLKDYHEPLKWQTQSDNENYKVKVSSRYLEKNPQYGNPDMKRTDYLIFDKKTGKHKHFSIGEDPETDIIDWHEWK